MSVDLGALRPDGLGVSTLKLRTVVNLATIKTRPQAEVVGEPGEALVYTVLSIIDRRPTADVRLFSDGHIPRIAEDHVEVGEGILVQVVCRITLQGGHMGL